MRTPLAGCLAIITILAAACSPGGPEIPEGQLFAPEIDPEGQSVGGLIVGHRLMDAQEPELALEAYTRAAAEIGLTVDVLSGLGSANLALGRLNQAERLLRQAVEEDEASPEMWNNLGVVLMERGKEAEAAATFRRAYALDNGQNDSIRDNLRLALAKIENTVYAEEQEQEFKLVRRGQGDFLLISTE
ncbi:Tetratricopeptide repeat-containing protein [Roseivivax lentus]|uniref:Tetratricopeptide repeat-containing protein n=1 Tax=Roseivivax lentus TaxID=633194 RepID=A0A1N7KY19_9RHOB|nr:tetratricopeptide repeat protein [Roseivivax lentus]SIS66320.1 Tetratricopeptide repeat-containing protein [Roseivivax lentus]